MNRERLDQWCEWGIFGLVLAIMVFAPLATGAVGTWEFLIVQGLTLGVMALWGLRVWINPKPRLLWPPLCWVVVTFTAYAVARYLTADVEYVARGELLRILVYATLFFAILNNLYRQETVQIMVAVMVLLGMLIAGYAIYQFVTGSDRVWNYIKPYPNRGSGTFICPNSLAGFLEMLLPLGLAFALVSRLPHTWRVILGYASLVILAGIGVSISRMGWVATAVSLLVFILILLLRRRWRLPAIILLTAVMFLGAYTYQRNFYFQRRVAALVESNVQTNARMGLWKSAWAMWLDHFWWGVGPAHFDVRYPQYRGQEEQQRPDRAHNDVVNTLADWGVVGGALVIAAWVLLFAGVARTWKYVRGFPDEFEDFTSSRFAFVLGASTGLLAILVHSFADFNMHIPSNAILAVALMAWLSSYLRFATDRFWLSLRVRGRAVATMLLALGMAYLGHQIWQGSREYALLAQARRLPEFSREQQAVLERAYAVDRRNPETTYAIGEALRLRSWQGNDQYVELAEMAMRWYERTWQLNPHDPYSYMRYGMCLHWLGRHDEAEPYFRRAVALDPNGYFTIAHMGWHHVQMGNYAAARTLFERSRRLNHDGNLIANSYLAILDRKLTEAATEEPFPGRP